jgi:C4-dicarboxylate-binding protein DctP
MKIGYLSAALAALLVGALPALPVMAQTKTVIKYAIVDPDGPLPAAQALHTFQRYVEFASDGKIEVQPVFAKMGPSEETVQLVKQGVLQMTNAEDGAFAKSFPPIQALNLPYLFPSGPVAWHFLNSYFARRLADEVRKATGLQVLAFTENGFRNIGNNLREVLTPNDVKGMKMRVMQSQVFVEFIKSLDATGIPLSVDAVVPALKDGVVDGQENSAVFMVDWGIADVQKFVSMTEHVYSVQLYLINGQFYDSLPEAQRQILAGAAQLASMHNIVLRESLVSEAIKKMRDKGIAVHITTPAEKEAFRKASQPPVLAYLRKTLGDDLMDGLLKAEAASATLVYDTPGR